MALEISLSSIRQRNSDPPSSDRKSSDHFSMQRQLRALSSAQDPPKWEERIKINDVLLSLKLLLNLTYLLHFSFLINNF